MSARIVFLIALLTTEISLTGQSKSYQDSLQSYFKKYVKEHEIVKGKDKDLIQFFPIDKKYKVVCLFEKTENMPWFRMESSGPIGKNYRVYGKIHFTIDDTSLSLNIYQGQDLMLTEKYRDHLFIPFTDVTSGNESYINGRYIDLAVNDIKGNCLVIDFNLAYNPYCAYVSGVYNCPIPPSENNLPVVIPAGEKAFAKPH